jgi:hypothetical protein
MKCVSCEKKCCKNCASFVMKIGSEDKWVCSPDCRQKYEQKVLEHPIGDIGAELSTAFRSTENELWYEACILALSENSSEWKYWQMLVKHGSGYASCMMGISDTSSDGKHMSDLRDRFRTHVFELLASNMIHVGRLQDAANVYEKELKMPDKARALREKDKQGAVKHVDITVNLNELVRQFKDGGIVAVYRCPHCGGKLKVDKNVDIAKLKVCEHCGSEIESMDLADFLKTALS